ncbi:hypothetical protein [Glycomyces buryatensis]|uniref:Uncharacterized protein n=1 Tax=Glycomyces buryatensis TaxID=2570927 RepID=A0A4S8PQT1_9ACTN|nr:hypothetical protein [Glycomyces buryatensis]THV33487.1 hypothetical protein FAB82_25440 [Glycomyces buryatensis]
MSQSLQPPTRPPRPGSVTVAVWLQILLAVALVVSAIVGAVYGADAEAAFEAELASQGLEIADLPDDSQNDFGGGAGMYTTLVVALGLLTLGLLNGAGKRPARIITWVIQPLVLVCGGFAFAGQLFLGPFLQWTFDNSGEENLEALDAGALVDAAFAAFPAWSVAVDWAVVLLATLGSLLVIILLAVPSANAFFRKPEQRMDIPGAPPQ